MKNIVIKASAGTGKTYRLSLHYIKLLLKGVNYENILITTFTRKATQEIKDRIFQHLDYLLKGSKSLARDLAYLGIEKIDYDEVREIKKDFKAEKISDSETLSIIKEVYDKEKFIIDPHTATAFGAINKVGEIRDTVALGTAHPYKFLETVKKATGENVEAPHQLEKFIDKDEKFDIVENNNEKIKKYILNKIQ